MSPNGAVLANAAKVRELRIARGWTQEKLSERVGCNKKTVENVEAGKPVQLRTLRVLSQVFGCTVLDLLADGFKAAEFDDESGVPDLYEPGRSDAGDAGGVLVREETSCIELTLDRDFTSFAEEEQALLLAAVRKLLEMNSAVRVAYKRPGSVKLGLLLTPEQAERLVEAVVHQGVLSEFGVRYARHVGEDEAIEATRSDSDEEIRQALQAGRARLTGRTPEGLAGESDRGPAAAPGEVEVQAERPLLRPPVALLCILDDGRSDGEWVRLRADTTVIGRSDGDVRLPHDGLVSGRHAELTRQRGPDGYRWLLADLQSTNGTFVRVGNTVLRNDSEVIVGSGRYRFESGPAPAPAVDPPGAPSQTTQAWAGSVPVGSVVPSLVELSPAGPVKRIPLELPEYWIGRDARACAIARPDDVLVNARHARLYRDAGGQWHIENNKSLNGVWLRVVGPVPLSNPCQFRVGEQRFVFRAL
jgi:pSer/pThr/pTyr-binding forkhead associated (FHA) protein/transcriptional regulator with XRE-family HTH domain